MAIEFSSLAGQQHEGEGCQQRDRIPTATQRATRMVEEEQQDQQDDRETLKGIRAKRRDTLFDLLGADVEESRP